MEREFVIRGISPSRLRKAINGLCKGLEKAKPYDLYLSETKDPKGKQIVRLHCGQQSTSFIKGA